jgi:hypothetical protein
LRSRVDAALPSRVVDEQWFAQDNSTEKFHARICLPLIALGNNRRREQLCGESAQLSSMFACDLMKRGDAKQLTGERRRIFLRLAYAITEIGAHSPRR